MDFFRIREKTTRSGAIEVYPDFKILRSKDLMIRGRAFYAIWDEERGLWSTDEYDVQRLVDNELRKYVDENYGETEASISVKWLSDFSSNAWLQFRNYVGHLSDSAVELDAHLTFSNTEVAKTDYVSRRLPYPLAAGEFSAWDQLVGTLYDPEERAKIEWAIGAIIAGDAKTIQKFLVFYGAAGTGKSTVLNVVQKLFEGYYTTFEAKALTSSSNAFSTEVFKTNPLVAIQHDGDLSRIEDNTKLNSIISHEEMTLNEKYKPSYTSRINAFLFMGTNRPVKITDAKSGIIRRLIDVRPSGQRISAKHYQALVAQIDFELGAIAHHCLETYRSMGKNYYAAYRPVDMMLQTDVFFNFIEAHYDIFKRQNGATLQQAYELYKQFCEDALVEFKLPRHKFREEMKNYFETFEDRTEVDGQRVRSWYGGFKAEHFKQPVCNDDHGFSLVMEETESLLDALLQDMPAQYANGDIPARRWENVQTTLKDLDTTQVHYVKVPRNHIVIDFDIKDATGEKSTELNLAAASDWPPTYAEYSKGGHGVHLHYVYDGDVDRLATLFQPGIEVKVYRGDAALRRRVSLCNNVPVATISSGLPLKEERVISADSVKSERGLRQLILRNLRKEIHPGTKPSMDFIKKILDDAYESGLHYDVTDMRPQLIAFANNSTNNALYCLKLVQELKWASEEPVDDVGVGDEVRYAFFDVEIYPNLFVVCWKYRGDANIVTMINPAAHEVEALFQLPLIGFNCRRYDNHILYAAHMGYNNAQLYALSQRIIGKDRDAMFGAAYDLSYADIWDFSSKKQSLKRFEIDLGIHHMELPYPWDQPVAEENWNQVAKYCANDVLATEATFEARQGDFVARQILSELSGLPVNASTQQHTARIIFGKERKPQREFVYTDLSEQFPGYVYDFGTSTYRGEVVGEGGYVYAEPGMYSNVALLDVASMHPTSIEELNLFGDYTTNFSALKRARLAIKYGDYALARTLLDGKLAPFLQDESTAEELSYALKIVINIVYGLTSAKFDNPFRDPRNKDNIVAKRGALFMIDLKHEVQKRGFTVAHIKTDSIKIPDATPEIIEFVTAFGEGYGYTFEHEETYDKFCLVNDAVYIAKTREGKKPAHWVATGAQFAHPFVFKTLFTGEPIDFEDMCETRSVTTSMHLEVGDQRTFIGRVGSFVPMLPGNGGGSLVREKDDKFYAVGGTKGYEWLEAEVVKQLDLVGAIDTSYFQALVDAAIATISRYGDIEEFVR